MEDEAVLLSGGNISVVVRVGDTVRRESRPWSATVLDLLRHLERQGFDSAPRTYGFDHQGREVLEFIPGQVGVYPLLPYMRSDTVLADAAHLLRSFHDATSGYRSPTDAVWQFYDPDTNSHEVVCHNDFAPYNLVFQAGRPRALIDYDTAGPGPRIWDVAYAVYRFVPLSSDKHSQSLGWIPPFDRSRRLRLFCDTYGLEERQELLQTVEQRLQTLCTTITQLVEAGDPAFLRILTEGHMRLYERDIDFLRQNHARLEQSLGAQ